MSLCPDLVRVMLIAPAIEQRWRSGENARLPQCGPGSIPGPGVIRKLSLLLVLCSGPRGFSPGTAFFPSSFDCG